MNRNIPCRECGSPMQEEPVHSRTKLSFVRVRCVKCGWLWWLAP
mgnify:CR=1 FL=1